MPHRVKLEVFGRDAVDSVGEETLVMSSDALEEARLEAFDKGYRAGWDDAVAAQEDEAQRLRAEIGRNLQALSFTYHEARGHLLRGLGPLMTEICDRVLPEVAHAALGGIVRETLEPIAAEALDRPVTLVLHPDARPAVEAALAENATPPLELIEETALAPGQLHLRWDAGERRIDLDAAVAAIGAAVTAYFAGPEEDPEPSDAPAPETTAPPPEEMRRHG